jgi:riboflavin synthase
LLLDVSVPDGIAELTVPHGSIAVDGVSLTVNEIPDPNVVQVALIPYTLQHTTLGKLQPGDPVHLEVDMIGKFVRQLLHDRGEVSTGGDGK